MKLKLLFILALFCLFCIPTASANAFNNPGFETGTLANWTEYQINDVYGYNSISSVSHAGSYSANVLFSTQKTGSSSRSGYREIRHDINWNKVTGHNISFWTRYNAITDGGSGSVQVYVSGTKIAEYSGNSGGWVFKNIDVSSYGFSGTTSFALRCYGTSTVLYETAGMDAYFDDIYLAGQPFDYQPPSSVEFNSDTYSSGGSASVDYYIGDYDFDDTWTYFVDVHYYQDGSWNLADRQYAYFGGSGSRNGTLTLSLPSVSSTTSIRTVLQGRYLPSDAPEGLAIDTATISPSGGGSSGTSTTIDWQSSTYDAGDQATALYAYAASGSYVKLLDTTTFESVQTWSSLSGSGSLSYDIPSDAYGHTYRIALYNSSAAIVDSDMMTVSNVVDGGLGAEWVLSGKVYNAETGAVISGATITDGSESATSSSTGSYGLTLAQGLHRVNCSASGYESRQLDLYLDQHSTHNWYLSPTNPSTTATDTLYGTVLSLNTGLPVQNAAVSAGEKTVFTSSKGYYELALSSSGSYTVTVSKTDYDTLSETVAVSGETNRDFLLVPVEYDGGTTTTPPGGGTTSPTDDDGGGQDGTGDSGDESSDTTTDSDEDGVPDNVDDSDGDGIVDTDDDTPYGRSDRIAAQNTMNKLSTQIPTLIELVILMVVFSLFGIKFGK